MTYKSAVAERGVYNWQSMAGTTDIPWFPTMYGFEDIPEGYQGLYSTPRKISLILRTRMEVGLTVI